MEVRISCPCGTNFKFDVEPERGGMPTRIACPNCGQDATHQANDFIHHALAAQSPLPPPPPAPVRVAATPPPPPPPAPHAPAPAPRRFQPAPAPVQSKSSTNKAVAVAVFLVFAVVGFYAVKIGIKVARGVKAVTEFTSSLKEAVETAKAESAKAEPQNLTYEDCVVLFVRSTNHLEVAQACTEYWKTSLGRKLTLATSASDDGTSQKGNYPLWPAHNGYVRLMGTLEWPQPQYEGVAKFLSQRLNTMVFETRDVDFTGAYHFGVYEKGVRQFHAQMDVKISTDNADEIVTTEGDKWALENGFTPGEEGMKGFHMGDAEKITQHFGMKFWDEDFLAAMTNNLVLREELAAPGPRPTLPLKR